jgi:hypothetical protein
MTPSIKLIKNIVQDDPRNLVCYVTLTVVSSSDIPKDIFVVKYIPPISAVDAGSKSFYNVAYVDQLADLPKNPSNRNKPCFLLSNTVTKAFANYNVAAKWCTEVYAEIQRLLSTYALSDSSGSDTVIDINELGYNEGIMPDIGGVDVDITQEEESSLSSESSLDENDGYNTPVEPEGGTEIIHDTIELTFDGKEIII